MTDLEEGDAWSELPGAIMPDQQGESFVDETAGACDQNPPVPASQAPKTRVVEALTIYPIISQITAYLRRKDVYPLALSCRAIFHGLNIQDPVSHRSIISRCVQKCHGPYMWGLPEHVTAPLPKEHEELERQGAEMGVRACLRKNCWNDVCKHCRQPPPLGSELRRRWICGNCLPGRQPEDVEIPQCSCSSVGEIYCLDCSMRMQTEDDNHYDFSEYRNSSFFEPADPLDCKNGERTVYYYACWDCGKTGEPPYDGVFICRWCSGSLPYTELIPWDIVPYSRQSCRVRLSCAKGGWWGSS